MQYKKAIKNKDEWGKVNDIKIFKHSIMSFRIHNICECKIPDNNSTKDKKIVNGFNMF